MRTRWATLATVVCAGLTWCVLKTEATARADDHVAVAAVAVNSASVAVDDSTYAYVGSKKCKKCHIKEHKSWADTRMAKAIDILKPGNSKEAKEKFNVDVNKDYSADPKCLKCHTTGYGKPGGYAIPDPNDKKAVRTAEKLEGVGCESCHGPGSEYIKVFEEILKSKRKYKVEELYAVGLRKIGKDTCLECHNEESPTVTADDSFDYEKRKDEGTHEHHPLKQRAE